MRSSAGAEAVAVVIPADCASAMPSPRTPMYVPPPRTQAASAASPAAGGAGTRPSGTTNAV